MQYLLLSRLSAVNIVFVAFIVLSWVKGWLWDVWEKDITWVSTIMLFVSLYGLVVCFNTAKFISKELDRPECSDPRLMELKLEARLETILEMCGCVSLLAIVGTVLGIVIALAKIQGSGVSATEISTMIVNFVTGIKVALYTTLVGTVLLIALRANYRLVHNGALKLICKLERGGE